MGLRSSSRLGRFATLVLLVMTLAGGVAGVGSRAEAQGSCVADDHTLCFLGDRLSVTVEWTRSASDPAEAARARPLGIDTGAFWFFTEDNLEVVAKLLDGSAINDSVWVFLASLSDLEFTVQVRDHATGSSREYRNPRGNRWGQIDIEAFPQSGLGEGEVCGGFRPAPAPNCGPGLFCEEPAGQCAIIADGTGICTQRPDACPAVIDPVCGCDGVTYGNDCERQIAGVSLRHEGECEGQAKMCGGIAGLVCGVGEVCQYPPNQCQVADLAGVCVAQPEVCTTDFVPVCGCDGQTYGNECQLLAAGVAKASDGACAP